MMPAHLGGETEELGRVRAEEEGHDHAVQRDLHLRFDSTHRAATTKSNVFWCMHRKTSFLLLIRSATKTKGVRFLVRFDTSPKVLADELHRV